MDLSKLTLIAYYCSGEFSNEAVSNEEIREFLRGVTGQEVTREEFTAIQKPLREFSREMITSTGEHTARGRPGRWFINDEGRMCARALLTALLEDENI
ncbi:MAG: hypothetical protein OXI80_04810 [Caldilineaceae bacterium]|nr:hypothetical protein [Caldilineaceae bacterium]MDE0336965.1 hypothetical protein [Caldilineaceae bacterium]